MVAKRVITLKNLFNEFEKVLILCLVLKNLRENMRKRKRRICKKK